MPATARVGKAAAAVVVPAQDRQRHLRPALFGLLGRRHVLLADARVEFVEQFLHGAA
jgi:hypothetical protein